jgi:hypothetical protein
MAISRTVPSEEGMRTDWVAISRELAPRFAARAAARDVTCRALATIRFAAPPSDATRDGSPSVSM